MNKKEDKANRRVCKNSSFGRLFTILVIVVISIFVLLYLILISLPPRGRPDWFICGNNMVGLGKAMLIYADDFNGKYPSADNWCDLLVIYEEVNPEHLVCKGSNAKVGESSYALNKNIAGKKSSEIPENTVILFETNYGKNPLGRDGTLGDREWYKSLNSLGQREDLKKHKQSEKVYKRRWNQVGGSDMLTTENHEGKGCWVLFSDIHAEFVKAERLGELKWDIEKKDSESID
jgi:hypothetical protein